MNDRLAIDTRALEIASEAKHHAEAAVASINRHMDECDRRERSRIEDSKQFRAEVSAGFSDLKTTVQSVHVRVDGIIDWRTKILVSAVGALIAFAAFLFARLVGLG